MVLALLKKAESFYDILSIAYEQIAGTDERNYINEFYASYTKLKIIYTITSTYVENSFGMDNFLRYIDELCTWINDNIKLIKPACVAIITSIDTNIPPDIYENSSGLKITKQIGPLNGKIFQQKNYIFSRSNSILFNGLKEGDKRNRFFNVDNFDQNSINLLLEKYIIIGKDAFYGYIPRIYKYNFPEAIKYKLKSDEGIKLALVPLTCEMIIEPNYEEMAFTVKGIDKEYNDFLDRRQIEILKRLNEENIDIVVFPEMLLTQQSLERMKDYLLNTPNSFKLIFGGTIWENKLNICYVLSGEGEIILKQNKFTSFIEKEDANSFNEYLQNIGDKYIEILDIDELGRIFTIICKDFINERFICSFVKQLRGDFAIIPAYTPSISKFIDYSKDLADKYQVISIVCNCCEPMLRKKKDKLSKNEKELNVENIDVGYIALPSKNMIKQKMDAEYFMYGANIKCAESCHNKACMNIFTIRPKQLSVQENSHTINIVSEIIFIDFDNNMV